MCPVLATHGKGLLKWLRAGACFKWGKYERAKTVHPESAMGILLVCINSWWEGTKKAETDCSQWKAKKAQTKLQGILFKYKEKRFSFCGLRHWHRMLKEVLESLSLEVFNKWVDTTLAHFNLSCFEQSEYLWRSLPASPVLWCCDSMSICYLMSKSKIQVKFLKGICWTDFTSTEQQS